MRLFGSNEVAAFQDADDGSWEPFTEFGTARAPADGENSPYGEEHRFDVSSCRYVRIEIQSNYGSTNVGVAEIQFLSSQCQS